MSWLWVMWVAIATAWCVLSVISVWRVRRRPTARATGLDAITILKPLCGNDADLESNLRSFFVQDHPSFEIVLGVEGEDDLSLPVARKLCAEYSHVRATIVVHEGGRGINPKVSNLRAMLEFAKHDLVVVSDSNVRVAPSYLREMAREMAVPGTGLVTNLIAGVGELNAGATLEVLQLNSVVAAGVAASNDVAMLPAVVGKSMMFYRSELARLGGIESVADVLAEDYVMGRMFHEAGYAVRLAPTPVENVVRTVTVRQFVQRQMRWAMIRIRMVPMAFFLEPLSSPFVVACAAIALHAPVLPLFAWAVLVTFLRDALLWTMLRGSRGFLRAAALIFLRDVLVLVAWGEAFFHKHVTWRGRRVRVSAGTRLYAERLASNAEG